MPQSAEAANTENVNHSTGASERRNGSTQEILNGADTKLEEEQEDRDAFGLRIPKRAMEQPSEVQDDLNDPRSDEHVLETASEHKDDNKDSKDQTELVPAERPREETSDDEDELFTNAYSSPMPATPATQEPQEPLDSGLTKDEPQGLQPTIALVPDSSPDTKAKDISQTDESPHEAEPKQSTLPNQDDPESHQGHKANASGNDKSLVNGHNRAQTSTGQGVSEWSHQQLAPKNDDIKVDEVDEWQTMPAFAPFDMYDDDNKLIAREAVDSDDEGDPYSGLGGAGKGYTRVQLDEDAQSSTSLDDNTQYLFKDSNAVTGAAADEDDDEQRDARTQMQATKDLLTEGQRIAYVGMTRLVLSEMLIEADKTLSASKGSKKETQVAVEAMKMWGQKMMVRLYGHMDISTAEQVMVEQLAEHGVVPSDLTPTLMQNARVKNPMAESTPSESNLSSPPGSATLSTHRPSTSSRPSISSPRTPQTPRIPDDLEENTQVPPPYQEHEGEDLPEVRTPSQLPTTSSLDIDLRWTVLCDLFLTTIADSVYDARSRVLLEIIGKNMQVDWLEICKFEKRVTDALEMQQAAEKENWNEDEHKESRRKAALKKRYVMMGLATVGGSLVIGLSAGLLAPVIGAGLAAGFTTIGVAGTSGFLAGAGGAAIITSAAATSGGVIAVRAANRRTGAVKTFEYRPLHNNKRVNLIVTVSGWMTGKVDDVRLPYSTVDPIMGDIYSVLWEPEMLRSMGDTINILATEALTQGLQQVLGSTILTGLMAALTLPVVLTKLSYLIDNPWTVSLDRANAAGLILADSLIDRNLGTRPITFVGYSLGSRVIFSCLKELSRKGAYGLVQNVYLFGAPIVSKKDEYLKVRSVIAGRFVNGYAKNDWILGYLFRLTSGGISRVAGLAPVEDIPGLENVDVTELVPGHMAYRTAMPKLLRQVGWIVEADEFTEIEDPDPENHGKRQRELINEIEDARKEFDKKERESKGGKFGKFFSRKKNAVGKKEWETYEESKGDEGKNTPLDGDNNNGVLFDVDAIRAELAGEMWEVKELESTLPPMRLDIGSPASPSLGDSLRETKSFDNTPGKLSANAAKRTPLASPAHPPPHHYDEYKEDEVSMTFDTSYQSPPHSASISTDHLPVRSSLSFTQVDPADRAAVSPRPDLKSSSTMSLDKKSPPADYERNMWADEDEDLGEKEIEMTFA